MLHHLVHLAVFALSVLLAAKVVPGMHVKSFGGAFVFALVLALLNKLLFRILIVLSFPLVLVTLGLFILVLNLFLFWLADRLVSGVGFDGFGSLVSGALVTSIINWGILLVVP